jgi:hypothetical protein
MVSSSLAARVGRLVFAVGLGWSALATLPASAEPRVDVSVEPLPAVEPLVGFARLEIRGGGVGGLSALLWHEADALLLASDRGRLFSVRLRRGPDGAVVDLFDWQERDVPLPGGWSRDVEGLAVSAGQLLASIEEAPHVLRFAGPLTAPERITSYFTQADLGFRANAGFEALTDLPDGGWLAVAETRDDGGHLAYARDERRFLYRAGEGYAPTGADRFGDRLFFVERRVSLLGGWQARVTCLPLAALAQEGPLVPVLLAQLGTPAGIDNMEGIAVRRRGADLDLLLVSDDNENPFQRTVLLHYRWPGAASGGCEP